VHGGEILALILALLAVLLRGLLAAAETALGSVGRRDAVEMADAGQLGAGRLVALKSVPEETTSAIRGAQVSLLAAGAALAGYASVSVLGRWGVWREIGLAPAPAALISALLGALVVAGLTFFAGDLVPRAVAAARPAAVARMLAPPVALVRWFLSPFIRGDHWLADRLLSALGVPAERVRPPPPLEDLERYLADHAARGTVSAEAPELIHSIFEFGQTTAKEVMVPRTRVVALEVGAPASEIFSTISNRGHTRLPVYEGEIDNIVGIINAKDILPLVAEGEAVELMKILRPAQFVPWSKPINELMRELQVKHVHMAMVVDEFGGLMGLITLEDILEEIVGEIEDEFDPVESRDVEALPDGSYLVRASIEIEEFNRTFSTSVPEDGSFETLAGFLNSLAGAIPKEGDTFFHEGLQLTVAKRSERRVRQVRVRRPRPGQVQAPPAP
jgi:putative hemolysin